MSTTNKRPPNDAGERPAGKRNGRTSAPHADAPFRKITKNCTQCFQTFETTWPNNMLCQGCYEGNLKRSDKEKSKVFHDKRAADKDFVSKVGKDVGNPIIKACKSGDETLRQIRKAYTDAFIREKKVLDDGWFRPTKTARSLSVDGDLELATSNIFEALIDKPTTPTTADASTATADMTAGEDLEAAEKEVHIQDRKAAVANKNRLRDTKCHIEHDKVETERIVAAKDRLIANRAEELETKNNKLLYNTEELSLMTKLSGVKNSLIKASTDLKVSEVNSRFDSRLIEVKQESSLLEAEVAKTRAKRVQFIELRNVNDLDTTEELRLMTNLTDAKSKLVTAETNFLNAEIVGKSGPSLARVNGVTTYLKAKTENSLETERHASSTRRAQLTDKLELDSLDDKISEAQYSRDCKRDGEATRKLKWATEHESHVDEEESAKVSRQRAKAVYDVKHNPVAYDKSDWIKSGNPTRLQVNALTGKGYRPAGFSGGSRNCAVSDTQNWNGIIDAGTNTENRLVTSADNFYAPLAFWLKSKFFFSQRDPRSLIPAMIIDGRNWMLARGYTLESYRDYDILVCAVRAAYAPDATELWFRQEMKETFELDSANAINGAAKGDLGGVGLLSTQSAKGHTSAAQTFGLNKKLDVVESLTTKRP